MRPVPTALSRRNLLTGAVGVSAALGLSACGQADNLRDEAGEDADPDGKKQIMWSWWGSDTRHQLNQELIKKFEADNPDITIVPSFTDWGGYWDKLATQTAGGDTPDVIMMENRYIRQYADRGVLANLSELDIDVSALDQSLLATSTFDGSLWALPTGVNVPGLMANPKVFEQAGVEMPDDKTWTWQDYLDIATQISKNTPEGTYGTQDFGFLAMQLKVWLRQRGASMWTEDGSIGFSPDQLAGYWQFSLDEISQGAAPSASESVEVAAAGIEQSFLATNRAAFGTYWSNQLATLSEAAGSDLQFLSFPGESEFERTGMFLKASQHLSISARSKHPEAAAKFVDWLMNSEEAARLILSDRGLRANLEVRKATMDALEDYDQQAADFIEAITPDIVDGIVAPPSGAGSVTDVLARINEQVLFGRISPDEGAKQFIQQAESATS